VVLLVVMGSYFNRLAKWTSVFDAISKRYRGSVSPATIFSRPALRMWYGQSAVNLRYRRRNTGLCTEFQITWPDRKLKLELCGKGVPERLWRRSTLETHELSDKKFAKRYSCSANESARAEELFSAGVIWQIEQIAMLNGTDEVYVSISNGHLLVSKQSIQRSAERINLFLQLCLELFDQLMLTRSEGIEFVENSIATLADDVRCPICADIIREEMVVCSRCKTPHCLDCWQYNSECATFACGSTKYYSPSTRRNSVNADPQ
jgi:hypothetical protein